jgi:hypothetical protein
MTIFGLKMMVKSGLEFFIFELNELNWSGRLAGISEGAHSISK